MSEITLEVVYNELKHVGKICENNNQILTGNGDPESGICFRIAGCENKITDLHDKLSDHIDRSAEFEKNVLINTKTSSPISNKTVLGVSPEARSMIIGWLIRLAVFFIAGKEAFNLMK